eukprot:TRINITY_DN1080_c0_g1_i3.p1 TRINITY_DN1080_c0_g1~~TRINITY_DN1080_c0_g1_i3.p1  ORF type:complete len:503 (-),score=81.31 TRINITY_DN1080_c0_g1_i3:72-1580(-)
MDFKYSLFVLFFPFLLLLLAKRKQANTQKLNGRLPPSPPKLPIIGNLHNLIGSAMPHHILMDLARKYGPLMHLRLGQISTYVVSSSEIAKEVMKTHDISFSSRPSLASPSILVYGCTDVAFSPYGDYWRQIRKICVMELLSTKRVQSFRLVREEEVSNLVQHISSKVGSTLNLSEKLFAQSIDTISRIAFGSKCQEKEAFKEAAHQGTTLAQGFNIVDFFPSLGFVSVITGLKFRLEKSLATLDRILGKIIEEHRLTTNKVEHKDEDLIDVLIRVQEESGLTNNNLKAIILDMFIGGTDTSSTIIDWVMAELMRHPRVMEKAQREVREVLGGKKKVEESDLKELNYLKLIIKETMRLHPPLPLLLPRESIERCEINGYEIPNKTRVFINAWAIARDPKHWENPNDFYPERFQDNLIDFNSQNFEFIPFGGGRRRCPGDVFGLASVDLALANLLYYFDWSLPDGMKPEDLDMSENLGIVSARKFSLDLVPISHFDTRSLPSLA